MLQHPALHKENGRPMIRLHRRRASIDVPVHLTPSTRYRTAHLLTPIGEVHGFVWLEQDGPFAGNLAGPPTALRELAAALVDAATLATHIDDKHALVHTTARPAGHVPSHGLGGKPPASQPVPAQPHASTALAPDNLAPDTLRAIGKVVGLRERVAVFDRVSVL